MLQTHLSKIVGLTGLPSLMAITPISANSSAMQATSGGQEVETVQRGPVGARFGIRETSPRRLLLKPKRRPFPAAE